MSADNWEICPNCLSKAREAYAAEQSAIQALYGDVPVHVFDEKRAELKSPDPEDFRTFREDYEIYGADAGEVQVSYSGHCSTCGAGLDFTDKRRFWEPSCTPTNESETPDA